MTAKRARRAGKWWNPLILALVVLFSVIAVVVAKSGSDSNSSRPPGTTTGKTTGAPATPSPAGAMPAITVARDKIMRDGQSWWFLGYNSFTWSANCGRPEELMTAQQVDDWFASMRHDGHGAVRLMFYDGWDINRLDAAIAAAKRNNIYVTVTLGDARNDCGEEAKTVEWFSDDGKRNKYRQHMTELLERYRGNTTIAWFEYLNEPGYVDGALRSFYDEMGAVAATIDPDRLFSSGTIAPYALGGDGNFRTVQESPGVDISSLHEYDYNEAESHQGPLLRGDSAGKPVIVGEFGVYNPAGDDAQCEADVGKRVDRVKRKVDAYLGTPGYIGAFAWAWQPGSLDGVCQSPGLDGDVAVQDVLRTEGAR